MVVGASSGMGAAVAKAISNDETTVILLARREEQLRLVQKELRGESIVYACDVCDYTQISSFFDFLKEKKILLSAMIYTAGICFVKPIKAMEAGELDRMFAVNVFGFYEMCRHFQSPGVSVKGASIVAFSSYASVTKESGMSAYAMTKTAMNTSVQVMAKEFSKRRIRVNAILPANTVSKMGQIEDVWSDDEKKAISEVQPLGLIEFEEIVEVVSFLISDMSAHVTGTLIEISAGYKGV